MAEERVVRRKARDIAWREPIWVGWEGVWPFVGTVDVGGGWVFTEPFVDCVEGWGFASLVEPFEVVIGMESGYVVGGAGGRVCERCTSTGGQPPGACLTFEASMPRKRGMEGPVRSMSRIPTEWPARERDSASWVVMEDLPTPPLPERTCDG